MISTTLQTSSFVDANVLSANKIGYIVVSISGRCYRVWRSELKSQWEYRPGQQIRLVVCDEVDDYGNNILSQKRVITNKQ